VLNGSWAQSTSLGFSIFIGGVCLASALAGPIWDDAPESNDKPVSSGPVREAKRRPQARSLYSQRLHGPDNSNKEAK